MSGRGCGGPSSIACEGAKGAMGKSKRAGTASSGKKRRRMIAAGRAAIAAAARREASGLPGSAEVGLISGAL